MGHSCPQTSAQNSGELSPPFCQDHRKLTLKRQASQTERLQMGPGPRCPVYIYSCSLEALREQMVSVQPLRHEISSSGECPPC